MTYTVNSPAGDTITVFPDQEWLELTEQPKKALTWTNSRQAILTALWRHGPYCDKSGLATRPLINDMLTLGYKTDSAGAFGSLIKSPAFLPALHRKVNGKRTYMIQLVAMPEAWHARMARINGTAIADAPVEPEPVEPEPVEPELPEPLPAAVVEDDESSELRVAGAVATALLTQVIEIISAGPEITPQLQELQADLRQAHHRLSQRLEENDKLRRELRTVQDELRATKDERDGLRQRLRAAEHNLEQAMKGDNQRIIMEEVHRQVDRLMRATPTSKGD